MRRATALIALGIVSGALPSGCGSDEVEGKAYPVAHGRTGAGHTWRLSASRGSTGKLSISLALANSVSTDAGLSETEPQLGSATGFDPATHSHALGLVPGRAERVLVRFGDAQPVSAHLYMAPSRLELEHRIYLAFGPPRDQAISVRSVDTNGKTLSADRVPPVSEH